MDGFIDFRPAKDAARRLPPGPLREGILSQPDWLPREAALHLTVAFYRQAQEAAKMESGLR